MGKGVSNKIKKKYVQQKHVSPSALYVQYLLGTTRSSKLVLVVSISKFQVHMNVCLRHVITTTCRVCYMYVLMLLPIVLEIKPT